MFGRSTAGAEAPAASAAVPVESVTNPDAKFTVELSKGENSTEELSKGGVPVNIRVVPPNGTQRVPTSLVCVVDISGSMGTPADPPGGERTGLNLLDVVKHALKAVLHTLGPQDNFALIPFSSTAEVTLPFTAMDATGLQTAIEAVNKMRPTGQTNMWDGMLKALDLAKGTADPEKQTAIFVFTDGIPNLVPESGHQVAYMDYQEHNKVRANMSCFGFGYNLESALLDEMSSLAGGVYSFIPDVGMVGTVFVHAAANLLSCAASECIVTVEATDGSKVVADEIPLLNNMTLAAQPSKLRFDLGMVNYGQARDAVVRAENPDSLKVTVECQVRNLRVQMAGVYGPPAPARCKTQLARAWVVKNIVEARAGGAQGDEGLAAALANTSAVASKIQPVAQALAEDDDEAGQEKFVADLLQDLEGQIAMSLSRGDWFNKWGRHFLPSIQRAHVLQQCTNFKDPGMQHYGGDLFRDVRDVADDSFNELPAPQPSVVHTRSSVSAAPTISMSAFNNAAGPCFATGLVLLATGERREVAAIAPGDRLAAPGDEVVTVQRVVETRFAADQVAELVDLGAGVLVTPWHPVRGADGSWSFPAELKPTVSVHVPAVYSFFLEEGGTYQVGEWDTVALGHGLTEPVVSHPFFADRARVAQALDALPATDGRVILDAGACLARDENGLVCGFRAPDCKMVNDAVLEMARELLRDTARRADDAGRQLTVASLIQEALSGPGGFGPIGGKKPLAGS